MYAVTVIVLGLNMERRQVLYYTFAYGKGVCYVAFCTGRLTMAVAPVIIVGVTLLVRGIGDYGGDSL